MFSDDFWSDVAPAVVVGLMTMVVVLSIFAAYLQYTK